MSWYNESRRHSLASRGVRSTNGYPVACGLSRGYYLDMLPDRLRKELLDAKSLTELDNLLARRESAIAKTVHKDLSAEFLDCDEMTGLLAEILDEYDIQYEVIEGLSEIGDSHVWIRVGNLVLDPTKQGTWDLARIKEALASDTYVPARVLARYREGWFIE